MSITVAFGKNLEGQDWPYNNWFGMLIQASKSWENQNKEAHMYICKEITSSKEYKLSLKTAKELEDQNLPKMRLADIINTTRILLVNSRGAAGKRTELEQSLASIAQRTEHKYQNGLQGQIRKILSILSNFLNLDYVKFFEKTITIGSRKYSWNISVKIMDPTKQNQLPWIIHGANLARYVANTISVA